VQIAGRNFFITGGASGLGAATARRLAAAGANVVICDVGMEQGSRLAAELGARALFVTADVTNEAQVVQAVAAARTRFGALHGAVSCAGIAPGERVVGKSGPHRLDTFRRVVEINLVGTFNVLRLVAQAMESNAPDAGGERGVIINTASVAAFDGQVGQAAYSASKAGVAGLTLPAARELAAALAIRARSLDAAGIRALAPGADGAADATGGENRWRSRPSPRRPAT